MDYKELGYSSSLIKQTATNAQPSDGYMYGADSPLMIGGVGAGQIAEGSIVSNIDLTGSITIRNGETPMVVLDKDGLHVKDESGVVDAVIVGRLY